MGVGVGGMMKGGGDDRGRGKGGRHGSLMVSTLGIKWSKFEPWRPMQDTQLLQLYLSPPRCVNVHKRTYAEGNPTMV